ncbi:transposable element Tcb1 transposase [Trichonephila clavipes]|nr:transposable element Tcb1 transposase [Trichonephila clavipes]
MTSKHHLTEELRWKAIGKLEVGQSQIEVSIWLNASPYGIHRPWQRFLTTDSASRKFSQGRPRATPSVDDRHLSLCARSNRTRERLKWALQHVHWMRDQWMAVLFTYVQVKPRKRWKYLSLEWYLFGWTHRPPSLFLWKCYAHTYEVDAYVNPYAREKGGVFVIQDDSVRPHRARIVDVYREQETIQSIQ